MCFMASMWAKISGVIGDSSCSRVVEVGAWERAAVEAFEETVWCLGRLEPDSVRLVPCWAGTRMSSDIDIMDSISLGEAEPAAGV